MAKHRDKAWYDAELDRLDALIRADRADEALALVAALAAGAAGDPAQPLGPPTLAGLPRRLHAARLRLARAEGDMVAKLGWQATQGPGPETLLPLARFTADERAEAGRLGRAPVPRLLHQIWIGELPRPPALAAWRDWCAGHGRDYLLWDEAALARIGAPDHPAYRAMLAAGDFPARSMSPAIWSCRHRAGSIWMPIFTPIRAAAISTTTCPRMGFRRWPRMCRA